jgi:hypothetical protein
MKQQFKKLTALNSRHQQQEKALKEIKAKNQNLLNDLVSGVQKQLDMTQAFVPLHLEWVTMGGRIQSDHNCVEDLTIRRLLEFANKNPTSYSASK